MLCLFHDAGVVRYVMITGCSSVGLILGSYGRGVKRGGVKK